MLLGCIKPRRVLLLLLLLLNIRPAAPVSAQPPPPPALRPLRPYVLADCRAPYRSLLVALTCRIERWEVSSVLCSAVREAVFRACRRAPHSGGLGIVKLVSLAFCCLIKFCKFLAGSFSAVSKPNFASKYAFDKIFKIYKICTLLHRSKFNILSKICLKKKNEK